MRIAIFTNNYLPNPFGVANSIESFRKQFEKRGHSVYIFAPKTRGYEDKNPNVFRYLSVDINYKISFPLAIPYSFRINKVLENLKLDIIHSQHHTLLGAAAAKWAKKKRIPLVFTWHTLFDQYVHFAPLIPKKWAAKWIIKKAVQYANAADCVITPTDSVGKIIRDWGVSNKNVFSLPTGIEENLYQNADGNSIRNKYDIKENEILLLLVSRLTAEKNIEFLLHSMVKILKENEKVKFLVVGEGNLLPALRKRATASGVGERIIFAGIISKEDLKNYYAAGDIFVYASKSETQGMIISEAMYMGLPIVAVAATGSQDLVENDINGFLVSEDEDKFSEAVVKLIENKNLRKVFSENSVKIARAKYTDRICADKLLEIYEMAIDNKKSTPDRISN